MSKIKVKKAIVAVLGAAVVTVHELIDQGPWSVVKTLLVLLAVLGAFTVYVAPNLGSGIGDYAKAFVALLVAGIETTIPLLDDSTISGSEWLVVAMAVLTAAGVPFVRNGRKPASSSGSAHRITSLPED